MGYITINKKYLEDNFFYFSKMCGGKGKIMVGLKDNAYGHGIKIVGKVLSEAGAEHAFVRSLAEAKMVEDYFKTILILIDTPSEQLPEKMHIHIPSLEAIDRIAEGNSVELFIDTGMHREGIEPKDIDIALVKIARNKLKLKGIFTHFASSFEPDKEMLLRQQKLFDQCVEKIKEQWQEPLRVHCASTAGVTALYPSDYDLYRVGVGMYGYSDLKNAQNNLKPVLSLYAERISTRVLNAGESIGYGSKSFIVHRENFTVSNYNIGYGDGFFRLDEEKTGFIADGRPILGRVSMDSFTVEGDRDVVCVFNNARKLAKIHKTIVYEILVSLHCNVERRLV